jgi:hypothetical protein
MAVIVSDPLPAAGVANRFGASHWSLDERRSGVQFTDTPLSPMRYVPTPAFGGAEMRRVAVDWQSDPTNCQPILSEIRLAARPFSDATNDAPSTVSTPTENPTVPPIENPTDRRGDEPQFVAAS